MAHRVLLIDDSKSLHSLVAAELAVDGLDVSGASDGISGIELAKKLRPDIILLDVSMPGMDGYEVCDVLAILPETSKIPVMFLSATADPLDRARGLNQGATDYIAKPFSGEELRARVRVAIRYKLMLEMEGRRAMRDGLTGLWNRAYLDDRLEQETAAAERHHHPLSCLMLDIDHFKKINDTYGHPFGDRVIRCVSTVLMEECRREDVVCRYGGEEFAVLCPSVNADGVLQLAERLRAAVAGVSLDGPDGEVRITCSIGIADGRGGLGPPLIAAADKALYAAKEQGRNRVCCQRVAAAAA